MANNRIYFEMAVEDTEKFQSIMNNPDYNRDERRVQIKGFWDQLSVKMNFDSSKSIDLISGNSRGFYAYTDNAVKADTVAIQQKLESFRNKLVNANTPENTLGDALLREFDNHFNLK